MRAFFCVLKTMSSEVHEARHCFEYTSERGGLTIARVDWTKELEKELIRLVEVHGRDWHTIARELDVGATYHSVRIKYARLRDTYQAQSISELHNEAVLDGKLFDERDALEMAGYDPKEWRISKVTDNAWGATDGRQVDKLAV